MRIGLVGHVTCDHILTPNTQQVAVGGTVVYAGATLLGLGCSVGIVTSGEIIPSVLAGASVHILQTGCTTTFENHYDARGNRRQFLRARALPIEPTQIPEWFLDYPVIHLGPVACEIPLSTVRLFRKAEVFLSADIQGFIRCFVDGKVKIIRPPFLSQLLPLLDLLKIGKEEMGIFGSDPRTAAQRAAELGPRIVIVTLGEEGSLIYDGSPHWIPSRPVSQVVDPTGAGDTYIAAFLWSYFQHKDLVLAGKIASEAAAICVCQVGPWWGDTVALSWQLKSK